MTSQPHFLSPADYRKEASVSQTHFLLSTGSNLITQVLWTHTGTGPACSSSCLKLIINHQCGSVLGPVGSAVFWFAPLSWNAVSGLPASKWFRFQLQVRQAVLLTSRLTGTRRLIWVGPEPISSSDQRPGLRPGSGFMIQPAASSKNRSSDENRVRLSKQNRLRMSHRLYLEFHRK